MATYFSGNGTQVHSADSLQTLYLMNPCYVGFPENAAAGNVVLMNQHDGNQFPGVHQQFVGIPLPATSRESFMGNQSTDMNSGFMVSNLRQHNHLWRNAGSELSFVPSVDQASPTDTNSSGSAFQIPAIEHSTSSGHQRLPEIPPPQHGLHRESQQGGLSLSLSSTSVQFMVSPNPFPSDAIAAAMVPPGAAAAVAVGSEGGGSDEGRVKWEGGLQSVLLGSKYHKVAQELLDDVVSVGKGLKEKIATGKLPEKDERSKRESASKGSEDPVATKKVNELTVAERQELQTKKAKLIAMLDEVDQRYKQYRHQVQSVVSLFEAAMGAGAAKAYTELALQTISKQFRCLRDTIAGQIRLTSRNLGEEVDCLGGGSKVEGSRLRSTNRQLQQQRAMQQLGMLQHNAWRPQRGLPERAISVLRAWLFEHFLHPYPKDTDKHILSKQTGLTRSQVSNWFINARVRLWKPMVEEMYMEETKEQENEGIPDDKTCSLSEMNEDTAAAMKSTETDSPGQKMNMTNWNQMEYYTPTEPGASPPSISTAPTAMAGLVNLRSATMFGLNGSSSPDVQLLDDESVLNQPNPKRITRNDVHLQDLAPFPTTMDVKPNPGMSFSGLIGIGDRHNMPGYAFSGGFSSYQLGDAGRYGHDMLVASGINTNCVSLTLGLPHCDSVISLSGSQSPYVSTPNMHLGRRHEWQLEEPNNDFCTLNPGVASAAATDAHSASGYENINIHSGKGVAAQLLPDFVT